MYRLTDSIPYLLTRAGVRMGELFSRELAELGMTLPMYRVLAALGERPDLTLGELAELIDIENSTLSRLIGRLRQEGWVHSARPEANARILALNLTAEGQQRLTALIPRALHYASLATDGLSTEEIEMLRKLLQRIHANLLHAGASSPTEADELG